MIYSRVDMRTNVEPNINFRNEEEEEVVVEHRLKRQQQWRISLTMYSW